MSLDIAKLRQLAEAEKEKSRSARGIGEERELSAGEAVKFLKGSNT